jgi:hypothetical protein
MKKTAALLLCIFLTVLAVPICAQETAAPSVNGFQYMVGEDGTAAITKYDITEITVPNEIDDHQVTILGEDAITYNNSVQSILLPDTLKEIQKFALYRNKALKSILIPAGVTVIGYAALEGCASLSVIIVAPDNPVYESVDGILFDKQQKMLHTYPSGRPGERYDVPSGTVLINDYAFSRSLLKEIVLPDSISEIGFAAFKECADLIAIALPSGVTSIGGNAFKGCAGLKSLTIPQGVTWIGTDTFLDCPGLTIGVYEGSYAHQYAVEKSVPFSILAN